MASTDDSVDLVEASDNEETNAFNHFMNNPAYMSSLMRRHVLKQMVKTLPASAQKRVKALKKIQIDYLKLEAQFFEEVYQIERKYQDLYQPLSDKRKTIVNGDYEPTDVEADYQSEEEDEDEEMSEKIKKVYIEWKKNQTKYPEDVKGIPDFWLTVFRNTEILSDMVQPHDEAILKKLKDIRIKYEETPMSYTLEFHFETNPHFKDPILTKQYFLRCKIEDEPFSFEGPEIYKCIGFPIQWHPGKNITVKTIKKKQKHKARGAVRTITKEVPNDSFFNFFSPPDVPEDESKLDEESQNILGTDFEIGHFLRARIIPKAVLYYTGDVVDDEDDDDDEEEEEEEEEEEDDDEDEEEENNDDKPVQGGGGKKGNKKKESGQNPAECQQQ